MQVPVLGLGTWEMGGRSEPDYSQDDHFIHIIRKAIEMGYSHLDTAEKYGAGHSEELTGQAIEGLERNKLFLTSKVWRTNLHYKNVIEACEKSLERLQTSYLDLYLAHFPNEDIPIKETMKAFDELIAKGLVRAVGLSNFQVEEFEEAQLHCKNPLVVNQIEYNLFTREQGSYTNKMESEILPFCKKNDIIFTAWRPLMKGEMKNHPLLMELSDKYGKTPAQLALNWLIGQKNIITIPKASSLVHLQENLKAVGWKLSEEDEERLNQMKV